MPFTARPVRAWSTSAAGTCRSATAPRSTSTTRCAAQPACSTSRTCASSTSTAAPTGSPRAFLRHALANNVDKLRTPGKALYSCLLADDGGVLDDLIVYFLREDWFRLVVNAATADNDIAWLGDLAREHAPGLRPRARGLELRPRDDLAMIAVQGPQARERAWRSDPGSETATSTLKPFNAVNFATTKFGELFIARTGYTGEDGFEIILPAVNAEALWRALVAARRGALRAGRARHAATRSRVESLRAGHGRARDTARIRPRVDGRSCGRARLRGPARAAGAPRAAQAGGSGADRRRRRAARKAGGAHRRAAMAWSPAGRFRRRSRSRSRSPGSRSPLPTATSSTSTFATSALRRAWSSRLSCARHGPRQ